MTIIPFLRKVAQVLLNPLIFLMIALAFLYFIYGVIKFLTTDPGDKGNTRKEARDAIIWGIVGMVVMFSVYGLIHFVLNSLGLNPNNAAVGGIIRNF
jgi:hypothetical protein